MLLVGPVYIMPRMTAATLEALAQLFPRIPSGILPGALFNLLVYGIVYWFVVGRSQIVDRVGRILFPIQAAIVVAVIAKGILTPISPEMAPQSYAEPSVAYGLLQGYSTGDLLCALMFELLLIQKLAGMGMRGGELRGNLLRVGAVGIGILALTHLGQMFVGAHTGGTIDLTLSALYARVVMRLWGGVGGGVFTLALLSASISCAVGLTASCAEFFVELGERRVKYRAMATLTCLLGATISCLGLDRIVQILGPLLQACYPGAILLVVYYTFAPHPERPGNRRAILAAILAASALALMGMVDTYNAQFGWNLAGFAKVVAAIPLAEYDFAWLPEAALAYGIVRLLGGEKTWKEERK